MATKLDVSLQPDILRSLCRVITEGGRYRGYKKDILTENLSERDNTVFVCPRCKGILRELCLSTDGEQFCSCCKKEGEQTHPNIHVNNTIICFKCYCPLLSRGCDWLGTLGDCENHLDTCGYVQEMCKLKCGVVLQRRKQNSKIETFNQISQEILSLQLNVKQLKKHTEYPVKLHWQIRNLPSNREFIQRQIAVAGYLLEFDLVHLDDALLVDFCLKGASNFYELDWPFRVKFVIFLTITFRTLRESNDTREFKSEMIEVSRGDFDTQFRITSLPMGKVFRKTLAIQLTELDISIILC